MEERGFNDDKYEKDRKHGLSTGVRTHEDLDTFILA